MTTPHRLQLALNDRSRSVVLDGHDVSDFVASVEVRALPNELPLVVLQLSPTKPYPAELDLLARVHVGAPAEIGSAVAEFLDAMDPLEVERAALARVDLENVPGGGTAAVLRQLAEWSRGA